MIKKERMLKKVSVLLILVSTCKLFADTAVTQPENRRFNSEVGCADAQGSITTVTVPGTICGVLDNKRKACSVIDDNGNRVQLKAVKCVTVGKYTNL